MYSWGVPGQIDRAKTPYHSDFDETSCVGLSWALNHTGQFLGQSELRFLSYRLGHFPKVALQHFLLRPITPPFINFSDLKLLFSDPKLHVEYDSTIIFIFENFGKIYIVFNYIN